MQMPGPRDIVIYRPGPRASASVVQKPWGWAHISVQNPGVTGGMVTGQIDTCITRLGTLASLKTEGQLGIYQQVNSFQWIMINWYYFQDNSMLIGPL